MIFFLIQTRFYSRFDHINQSGHKLTCQVN